jgi:hypothetical protein
MTKEELKQEAEEFVDSKKSFWRQGRTCIDSVKQAYLAGAEPREKRIAELEHQLTHRNCLDCSNHSSKLRMRTLDLEKENAELKDYRLTTLAKQQTDMSKYALNLEHKLSWYDDQLTKAKEIIKEFMKYEINEYDGSLEIHFEELKKQAEQFLNSEAEK